MIELHTNLTMQVRYIIPTQFSTFGVCSVCELISSLSHSYGFTAICSVLLRFLIDMHPADVYIHRSSLLCNDTS